METVKDLEDLAVKLNPAVGYWNPTSLADMEFWGQSQEATIGFLRQAEIKCDHPLNCFIVCRRNISHTFAGTAASQWQRLSVSSCNPTATTSLGT